MYRSHRDGRLSWCAVIWVTLAGWQDDWATKFGVRVMVRFNVKIKKSLRCSPLDCCPVGVSPGWLASDSGNRKKTPPTNQLATICGLANVRCGQLADWTIRGTSQFVNYKFENKSYSKSDYLIAIFRQTYWQTVQSAKLRLTPSQAG